jgi:hypothetical protein
MLSVMMLNNCRGAVALRSVYEYEKTLHILSNLVLSE